MKVLLDTCVWGGTLKHLAAAGLDTVWTGNWPDDPGDEEILALAYKEGRVLATLDKDFGELAVFRKTSHCGIVRLVNIPAKNQGPVLLRILNLYGKELRAGSIITVSGNRVRIRPPDAD